MPTEETRIKTITFTSDSVLDVLHRPGGDEVTLTISNGEVNDQTRRVIAVRRDELIAAIGEDPDSEFILVRKSDMPIVEIVNGYWQAKWGHELAEDEGEQSFYEDALLALAQSRHEAAHPQVPSNTGQSVMLSS